MNVNDFFSSSFTFTDEEYELKWQYYMLNGMLGIVIIVLTILACIRFYQENYLQAVMDTVLIFISIFSFVYIKKSKQHVFKITTLLLIVFFLFVSLSFVTAKMYVVGASWFIILLLPAFYIRGIKGGLELTIASFIAVLVLGQVKENSYDILEYFYILVPMLMAALFTYMYEKRVMAGKELLVLKNRFLEEEVNKKIKKEVALLRHNKELADVISKSNIELFILDYESNHYLYANQGGLNALGYTLEEILKMSVYDTNPTLTVEMVDRLKEISKTTKNIMNITQHQRKDGSLYGVQSLMHEITYEGKRAYAIYDINLNDQQKAQQQLLKDKEDLLQKAHYDTLTNLPNRALFNDRLIQAIAKSNRYKKELAILFIDLDKFKEINDTLGHIIGDNVLCEVASRFQKIFRKTDTIARLGGDEFVCIIEELNSSEIAAVLAKKLIDTIKEPMIIDENTISLTCSIGISIYPKDAKDITSLLHHADSAMYKAKDSGKDKYEFY